MTLVGVLLPDGIVMWSVMVAFTGAPKFGPTFGPKFGPKFGPTFGPKPGPVVGPLLLCGMQLGVLGSTISLFVNCTLNLRERWYTLHLQYRKITEINKYMNDTKAIHTITEI